MFLGLSQNAASLLSLTPKILLSKDVDISEALKTYEDDLDAPELVPIELDLWRAK